MLLAAKAHVQRQIRQGILGILVLEVNGLADAHICDISRNAKIEVLLKEAGKIPRRHAHRLRHFAHRELVAKVLVDIEHRLHQVRVLIELPASLLL